MSKPVVTPNTVTPRTQQVTPKMTAKVVPVQMFAAEVTDHRTGKVQVHLGVELGGALYAFPKGKDLNALKTSRMGLSRSKTT